MKLSYYPGCSLVGTAAEYDRSIRAVAVRIGIELTELDDWNCCGASAGHMTDPELAVELAERNLALADTTPDRDLLVPCAACFQRLRVARQAREQSAGAGAAAGPEVLHLTRLLARPDVLKRIQEQVTKPLSGLRLACYHGCLSLRPPHVTGATDAENPQGLARLVAALGAEAVAWSHATECCSGSLSMSRPDIARQLVGDITSAARRGGALAFVTDCPLCQANLETRQGGALASKPDQNPDQTQETIQAQALPVFYITELIGHALGLVEVVKLYRKHLVDPRPALQELGL